MKRQVHVIGACSLLGSPNPLIGFEIVELNPSCDINYMTRELAFEV
jgi:arginase family enzyme